MIQFAVQQPAPFMNDPASFLTLGVEDPVLKKLETYRLYKAGESVTEIAKTFGFSRGYLYEMWNKFENEGTVALINKHWGAAPRKKTQKVEADVLRAKAINPLRSDNDLAKEFGLHRSTVYRLLKEHGLQDLHHVLVGEDERTKEENEIENEIELVPSSHSLLLTLFPAIQKTDSLSALSILQAQNENALYSDSQLHLALLLLVAWGIWRLSHINDQPIEEWGLLLDSQRRPDSDTLDQYIKKIIELDEATADQSVECRLGQVVPGGLIEQAQLDSFCQWVKAGLTAGDCWYFDIHVIEYTGKANLGKTKHGTKAKPVKAVKRFTISNGLCSLDYYAPTCVSFAEGCRHLVTLANQVLEDDTKIRLLAFDREGWDRELLNWLEKDAKITPVTWVKKTKKIEPQLDSVSEESFQNFPSEENGQSQKEPLKIGKDNPKKVLKCADVEIELSDWGTQRVVLFETEEKQRVAIYTTATAPTEQPPDATPKKQEHVLNLTATESTSGGHLTNQINLLSHSNDSSCAIEIVPSAEKEEQVLQRSPCELLDDMRFKQQLENQFKVEKHEMGSDAIPTHAIYETTITTPIDIKKKEDQLESAQKRVEKYQAQTQKAQELHKKGEIDKHQLNCLQKRSQRLEQNAQKDIKRITEEVQQVESDENGQNVISRTIEVLDVRKLTLLNLFKHHALVILKLLAQMLGIPEAGPERLRRAFFPFGRKVEFDPQRKIATVYAGHFPNKEMRDAYAHLCVLLNADPPTLTRKGITYYLKFK